MGPNISVEGFHTVGPRCFERRYAGKTREEIYAYRRHAQLNDRIGIYQVRHGQAYIGPGEKVPYRREDSFCRIR